MAVVAGLFHGVVGLHLATVGGRKVQGWKEKTRGLLCGKSDKSAVLLRTFRQPAPLAVRVARLSPGRPVTTSLPRRCDQSTRRQSGACIPAGKAGYSRNASTREFRVLRPWKHGVYVIPSRFHVHRGCCYIPPPPPLLHARGGPPGWRGAGLGGFDDGWKALPGARHPLRGSAGEVFPLDPLGGLFSGNQRVLAFELFAGLHQVRTQRLRVPSGRVQAHPDRCIWLDALDRRDRDINRTCFEDLAPVAIESVPLKYGPKISASSP